jgi:hypothetical protein
LEILSFGVSDIATLVEDHAEKSMCLGIAHIPAQNFASQFFGFLQLSLLQVSFCFVNVWLK